MRFKLYRIALLVCALHLHACATKGYSGPDLPDEQLATVALKAPVASLIPLFWIFPLNMLTWFSEDWYETSWNSGVIAVSGLVIEKGDEFEVIRIYDGPRNTLNKIVLNRFKTVHLLPGRYQVGTEKEVVISSVQIRSESCSTGICTCTTDDKKNKTCTKTTTCSTPYRVRAHGFICQISIDAKAGEHYEAFIRDRHIMENNPNSLQLDQEICFWGTDYSYETSANTSTPSFSCTP